MVSAAVPLCCGRRRGIADATEEADEKSISGVASYSRYSSDMQDAASIVDQQRKCRERAERDGFMMSVDLEFYDEAVSGTLLRRHGFDRVLAAAAAGRIRVLYIENLARLARESVISMPILKRLTYVFKVRVISVDEPLDTFVEGWEVLATILALQGEQHIRQLAKYVFRGQEGAVLREQCVGDQCFGYGSEPIPGTEHGRNRKLRKRYVIDPVKAKWVLQVFYWFTQENREIAWIVRELNRLGAPKDHRATTKTWRHQYVVKLLKNKKYLGIWPWGERKNVRDPETGRVSQEERPAEETRKWTRSRPDLQIVPDEWYEIAKRKLADNQESVLRDRKGHLLGSKRGAGVRRSAKHHFSGLVYCDSPCTANWHTGGKNGKYLFCSNHKVGLCECALQLRVDLLQSMVLNEIGLRIKSNAAWRAAVELGSISAHEQNLAESPNVIKELQSAIAERDRIIENLLACAEAGKAPADLTNRLAKRREEVEALKRRLDAAEREAEKQPPPPTEAWIDERLAELATTLSGAGPAASEALRRLLDGPIVVKEIRVPGQKAYLEGRFRLRTHGVLAPRTSAYPSTNDSSFDSGGEEIVLQFREPEEYELLADEAKALWDQGLKYTEIAVQLNCGRALVARAIAFWHTQRGLPVPDGRSCRKRLPSKRKAVELQPEIMELWLKDVPINQIAKQLHCCIEVVQEAVAAWHAERGLPAPDCRTCRKNRAAPDGPKTVEPPPSSEGPEIPNS